MFFDVGFLGNLESAVLGVVDVGTNGDRTIFSDLDRSSMVGALLPVSNGHVRVFDNHNTTSIRLARVSVNFSLVDKALLHLLPLNEDSRRVVVNIVGRDFSRDY